MTGLRQWRECYTAFGGCVRGLQLKVMRSAIEADFLRPAVHISAWRDAICSPDGGRIRRSANDRDDERCDAGSLSARALYPPRRAVVSWLFFDWAAQPFFTLITTFVFAPYFVDFIAADPVKGQSVWGYALPHRAS